MKEFNSGDSDVTYNQAPLTTELKTFKELLPVLLETNPGDWALIQGTRLGGVYSGQMEAIAAGYEMYGNRDFLTRQILENQPEHFYDFSEAA